MIAAYIRTSTDQQHGLAQRAELERALHGQEVAWYVDRGESGAKHSRPELDRMLIDLRKGRVSEVWVWKLDRVGRSVEHLARLIADFGANGWRLVSLTEGLDLSTPPGRMVAHVLAAVAEMFREQNSERVKAGLRAAKARGVKLGRSERSFDVARARRLRSEGMSWRKLAKTLGYPMSTLRDKLAAFEVCGKPS